MLDPKKKQRIIKKFQTHENDTGSSEVQIAILNEEIKELTEHLKTHRKDHSSRRGLLKKVNERKKLIRYLLKENRAAMEELAKKLKLKLKIEEEKTLDEIEAEEQAKRLADEAAEAEIESQKKHKEEE